MNTEASSTLLQGHTAGQKAFRLWAYGAFALMFSILLWHPSRAAAMNIMDGVFFLPALLLSPLWLYRYRVSRTVLLRVALPLVLYLGYALVSISWSDTPNPSRSIRMATQLLALFLFLGFLWHSRQQPLLESLLWTGAVTTAVVACWHMIMFYGVAGMPLGVVMYNAGDAFLLDLWVKPMNSLHATLVVVPQMALLGALMHRCEHRGWRLVGAVALVILLVYVVVLERRTGQVALVAAVMAALVVTRHRFWLGLACLLGIAAAVVLVVSPELVTSRGLSWRPQIWWSSFQRTLEMAPWTGYGLSNTMPPVMVPDPDRGLVSFVHSHNMVLAVFHYMGLAGVLLWLFLWMPTLLLRLTATNRVATLWITLPVITGLAAMMFDGGYALAAFDYDWFCFWFPVILLLSSFLSPDHKWQGLRPSAPALAVAPAKL